MTISLTDLWFRSSATRSPFRQVWLLLTLGNSLIAWGVVNAQTDTNYSDREVSAWVADLNKGKPVEVRKLATNAIAGLGTIALPYLMEEERSLAKLESEDLTNYATSKQIRQRVANAESAFAVLGPAAAPSIPELRQLLNEGRNPLEIALVLTKIDSRMAADMLTETFTNKIVKVRAPLPAYYPNWMSEQTPTHSCHGCLTV